MAIKKWNITAIDTDSITSLQEQCQINKLNASILVSRGHTTYSQAVEFLTNEDSLSDPLDIQDMEVAVGRINEAMDSGEKITIYGDYDCDGITSTTVLYTYFNSIGVDVEFYIPSREKEGYGLNKDALQNLADNGTTLVITVDNGISAVNEVDFANSIGLDVIITDHHQPGEVLPNAVAVVDPHRKDDTSTFKHLAGCGVALKLIAALQDGDCDLAIEQFSDIVAIGTIADIVDLGGENRTIVRQGLYNIKNSDNFGINALLEVSNIEIDKINSTKIAFSIAPRINAAGRIGDPNDAVKLLTCEDPDTALELAKNLDKLNAKRKEIEAEIIDEIEASIQKNPAILSRRVLMISGKDWHHGVIGIVCSKLVEKYGKPTFVMTNDGDILRGSARSFGDFHLFKALIHCNKLLDRFGGHKQAAGYSVLADNFNEFVAKMEEYASQYHDIMPPLEVPVDLELKSAPTVQDVEQLGFLEPFGCANEAPIFLIQNCTIKNIRALKEDKHQKLTLLLPDSNSQEAMLFFTSTEDFIYNVSDKVDILVNAELNEYKGNTTVSMIIKDIRTAKFNERQFFTAREYYNKIIRGDEVDKKVIEIALPERAEINQIYGYLRDNNGTHLDVEKLFLKIGGKLNYCKFRVILTILHQANLIKVNPSLVGIKFVPPNGKVDLNATVLMQLLQSQL